tara:strand:- start:7244 stop:7405 length:162 start_codon:yes stop_codon:yes gene_type:complete
METIIALLILSGKLVGPGTNKKLRPAKSFLPKKLTIKNLRRKAKKALNLSYLP